MSSPELTFQSAVGKGTVPLDSLIKIVRNKKISEIVGYQTSVGGKPIVQATHSEIIGNKNAPLKRVVVKLENGSQGIFHKNSIVISGKGSFEDTQSVLSDIAPIKNVSFKITNTTMTWQLHKQISLPSLAREYQPQKDVSYEPEIFPGLTLRLYEPLVSVKIFQNGVIIASGTDLRNIKQRVQTVVGKFTGVNIGHQIAARRNLKGKREHMRNQRYPVVNWNNNTNGFYVKPGPDRQPRRYKLPANPRLVISKVRKAYANAGVQIKAPTRRALGMSPLLSNKVSPPPKQVYSPPKRVAKNSILNWNANKPGYYVKPGPGGLAKFYKIPKGIKAAKKTVLKAYSGMKIPKRVREIFEITNANTPPKKQENTPLSQDCMKFTVKQLIEILRKRGIAYSGLRKQQMCERLGKKKVIKENVSKPNFTINGVPHYILKNTEQIKRDGKGTKKISSFLVSNLRAFANKLGGHYSKATKANLIKRILGKRTPTPTSVNSQKSLENAILKAFEEMSSSNKTPTPNSLNERAKLIFNRSEAPEFAAYYRLQGKKYPQNLNRIISEFKALKLKEQLGKYKNVEIM